MNRRTPPPTRSARSLPGSSRPWILALCLFGTLSGAPTAQAQPGPAVRDYLVMDVCVDGRDRPIGGSPLSCERHRDLRPGEAIDYAPADYPEADDQRCFARAGYVRRYTFPLAADRSKTSQEVLLSAVDRGGRGYQGCDSSCKCQEPVKDARFGQWDAAHDGISVLTHNSQLAWIMASKAQDRTSYFLGESCASPKARGIERFSPTWVLSRARLPATGEWDHGIFRSKLSVNALPSAAECQGHRSA